MRVGFSAYWLLWTFCLRCGMIPRGGQHQQQDPRHSVPCHILEWRLPPVSTILTICVLVLPLELYSFWINTWLGKVGLVIYTREQGFWLGHCMHIHESAWNLISYTKLGWGVIWLWQATPSSMPKTYPVGWGDGWKTPTYQSDTYNWHDFQL